MCKMTLMTYVTPQGVSVRPVRVRGRRRPGETISVFDFLQRQQSAAASCLEAENSIGCFKSAGLQATPALPEIECTYRY